MPEIHSPPLSLRRDFRRRRHPKDLLWMHCVCCGSSLTSRFQYQGTGMTPASLSTPGLTAATGFGPLPIQDDLRNHRPVVPDTVCPRRRQAALVDSVRAARARRPLRWERSRRSARRP